MRRLSVTNVFHRFDETLAVDDVSIHVEAGELVCLLGPSGSGKTTLLSLVAGLKTLQNGRITIGDTTVADSGHTLQVPPEKRGVGLMVQDYALFPHLTVTQNIGFGLRKGSRDSTWIERALDKVQLAHLGERYPHTLSGGQQQRIALLRALAPDPNLLLLDEPFSGLDEHLKQRIRHETQAMLVENGATTLMVTHNPEEAMLLADRIIVLNHGRVTQDASPVEVYAAPADPFTARLFGPTNELKGVVRDGAVDTVLGRIPTTGLEDGRAVLCVVRAGGVEITTALPEDGSGHVRVRVESARAVGPMSYLRLMPLAGEAQRQLPVMIEARLPGIHPPEVGREFWACAHEDQTFVFALD